ncbi:MAG: divalent cation tolerance protein CutA [Wigglesworthia glossinidia]|nr:divalent cation tolerance protein CutA [Wigglesworthia glossinidia]
MNNIRTFSQDILVKRSNICIILCTFPDIESTHYAIKHLLKNKLAACITQLTNVTSFYYWNNILTKKKEIQILIKSKLILKNKIFLEIKKLHPYDVPELIVLSTESIEDNYKKWIEKNTSC